MSQTIITKNLEDYTKFRVQSGFEKESFLFAFFCIATIYQRFIFEYPNQIQILREIFKQETQSSHAKTNAYSDIKLLDLILWKIANLDSNS
ncbi:hypothetical protein CLV96_3864 [Leptospira meyeri]|uniref:Uncharacterized protein n=1 Tax=Leptospira meyeri TaxID=29508 RepID=A0A4V3HHR3_LEPME|nr:hypothetical protein [Leptospira meyeri]EKJ85921.1 hypothetical protein LEP1GSC017_0403 [Leptospira meyeri serovar Hardjo str. Went 5]TDY66754.1 hypothetical protein CLV96_3864 [Leptospira meyeri]